MPPEDLKRKLAAILSADVAGYSRLMADDEEATIRTLTDYRSVMAIIIQRHRGRVVDSPGDNLLAVFASVVDSVNSAVEIQEELAKRNAELPQDRKMQFRIGVNLGDVVTEEERVYGDGVNIAARLESLAEPGGICLSGSVYSQVKSRLNLECENLGEQEVKNIEEPVPVYRVLMGTEAAAKATGKKKTRTRIWRKAAIALGVIVVLLALATAVIWNTYFRLPDVRGVSAGMKEFELPDGPSIAVLPFVNMSGDPEQEYFSDGLTENIITGLSSDGRLFVIARNSTFAYKGKSVDIQEVGRKLGAQYVVEGSVQKTEDRVRITVQLIDAKTGHHVWSDRYDRELKDIFALQDEITVKITHSVGMTFTGEHRHDIYGGTTGEQYSEELIPPSGSLEAYMKAMKATEYYFRFTKEDNVLARREIEEAIALDPEYAYCYTALALTHLMDLYLVSTESPLISFAQASRNIKKALALDDESWFAHLALANLYLLRKEHDNAIAATERAITLNPSAADAYKFRGFVLILSGSCEEGIKFIEKAMRLNPITPAHYPQDLGFGYYGLGRYEDAIEMFNKALKQTPNNLFAHIGLAGCYSALGREEEARRHAEEVLKLDPTFSLEQYAEMNPLKDRAEVERWVDLLRKAGLK